MKETPALRIARPRRSTQVPGEPPTQVWQTHSHWDKSEVRASKHPVGPGNLLHRREPYPSKDTAHTPHPTPANSLSKQRGEQALVPLLHGGQLSPGTDVGAPPGPQPLGRPWGETWGLPTLGKC